MFVMAYDLLVMRYSGVVVVTVLSSSSVAYAQCLGGPLSTDCVSALAQYFPGLYVVTYTLLSLLLEAKQQLFYLLIGTYSAWVYLRFFQQQPETGFRGDPSDTFRFSSFFPPVCAPPLDLLGAALVAVFRLDNRAGSAEPLLPKTLGVPPAVVPEDQDSRRRRERGARALEERLGMKPPADPESGHQQDDRALPVSIKSTT